LDSSNLGSATPRVVLVDIGFVCVAIGGSRIVTLKDTGNLIANTCVTKAIVLINFHCSD
jgi:hypothetical protein